MKMQLVFISVFLSFLSIGCQAPEPETKFYVGVRNQDTARLTLSIMENSFYGKYEIRKNEYTYRTGNIQGKIKGDTLIGDFYYIPYGAAIKKRTPLALLQLDRVIVVGKGVISSYMGIPFFVESIPIDYDDPEFVLMETNSGHF